MTIHFLLFLFSYRGDVVISKSPSSPTNFVCKRVAATVCIDFSKSLSLSLFVDVRFDLLSDNTSSFPLNFKGELTFVQSLLKTKKTDFET